MKAKEKPFSKEFRDAYPFGVDAVLPVYEKYKNLFQLREAFKRNGVLYELLQFWGDIYTYSVVMVDNKLTHYDMSSISSPIQDYWSELLKIEMYKYFNGCPLYTIENSNEVEIVKTERRFIEFHKIPKARQKSPLKELYTKIEGTVYSIGRPVMYKFIEDKKQFFYDKDYRILKYDLEQNLLDNRRFNQRYSAAHRYSGDYTKVLNGLITELEKERERNITGHYSDTVAIVWNEPNPDKVLKLQDTIDKIKKFQETYKGQD
jgi:hypothetical protein